MANKYSPSDMAFLIESNRFIREVKILKFGGGLYTVRFTDSGGGIKVRENQLFATKEDAETSLKKETKPRSSWS